MKRALAPRPHQSLDRELAKSPDRHRIDPPDAKVIGSEFLQSEVMRQEFYASLTFGRSIEVGRYMQVCDEFALPQRVTGHIAIHIIAQPAGRHSLLHAVCNRV
jgi:hypothetical protein